MKITVDDQRDFVLLYMCELIFFDEISFPWKQNFSLVLQLFLLSATLSIAAATSSQWSQSHWEVAFEFCLLFCTISGNIIKFECFRPHLIRTEPNTIQSQSLDQLFNLYTYSCKSIYSCIYQDDKHLGANRSTYIRSDTVKPKYFWIQIWLYQTFLIILR